MLSSFYTGSIKDAIQICDRKTASIRPRVCVNSWKLSLSLTSGTLLPDVLHRTFYGVFKDLIKTSDAGSIKKYINANQVHWLTNMSINREEPLIPLIPRVKVYEVQDASADDPFDREAAVGNLAQWRKL